MDILNYLPKNTAEKIRSNYQVAESIDMNEFYGVIRNTQFFENAQIKSINGNDVHIVYTVQTAGRDYIRNEIVPHDKTIFFQKMEGLNGLTLDTTAASKTRLKTFFKRNYIKKYGGL
jgi:hypothetical protein